MPTLDELESVAKAVREDEVDDPHGQCFPASKALRKRLVSEFGIGKNDLSIEEVRMGPSATRRHYVVAFPASEVSDSSASGRILIDITLDQYCTEYEEAGKVETSIGPKDNIPSVVIYETKSQAPYTG